MSYLILITIFLVSIFLYLLIELKRSIHMIYIIPLTILFTGGTYFYLDSLYGYPTWKTDEKKFGLLSFQIDEEADQQLDETTLKSMGNEGRKNIIKKFNIEKMCFSTYSEYKKLIN